MDIKVMGDGWIDVDDALPAEHKYVLVLISDEEVAISRHVTVARLQVETLLKPAQKRWWAGVPGKWHLLSHDRWIVTHWREIPVIDVQAVPDRKAITDGGE